MTSTLSKKSPSLFVTPHLATRRAFPSLRGLRAFVVNGFSVFRLPPSFLQPPASSLQPGLSLVELLIAIGILGVTMMLIGAAFPAGVAMSVAVSDETTSQAVFQKALAEIKANLTSNNVGTGDLAIMSDNGFNEDSRKLSENSSFSWTALVRKMGTTGPMGNLCQVVIVVSRRAGKNPNFVDEDDYESELPELREVTCISSDTNARTLTIEDDFDMVPNDGYIIDATTGTAYIIVSRDEGDPYDDTDNKIVLLSKPPTIIEPRVVDDGDTGDFSKIGSGWEDGTGASANAAYDNDYLTNESGSGADKAEWKFTGLPEGGSYNVYATWVPRDTGDSAPDAPYTIFDNYTSLKTIEVDQTENPQGIVRDGATWQLLGRYPISSGTLKVQLSDNASDNDSNPNNGTSWVVADGIRIISAESFWIVPGPQSGDGYSLKSPSIRVFQALLYLP